jgi:hypothetical protein
MTHFQKVQVQISKKQRRPENTAKVGEKMGKIIIWLPADKGRKENCIFHKTSSFSNIVRELKRNFCTIRIYVQISLEMFYFLQTLLI